MTIIDRAERAFIAHRDALQEIQRHGQSADPFIILDSLTTINRWGDRDQRADLTSEILDAVEAGELDDTARRSLDSTLEYLDDVETFDALETEEADYREACERPYVPTSLTVDAPWLARGANDE